MLFQITSKKQPTSCVTGINRLCHIFNLHAFLYLASCLTNKLPTEWVTHSPETLSETLNFEIAEGSSELRSGHAVTGNSKELILQAMLSPCCQAVRPSLLAAAVLVLDRQARGMNPLWPASLSRWTGISGPGSSEFEAAISAVLPGLVKY